MSIIDALHRWTGGLIGLLLAMLGLSGVLLAHKDAWLRLTLPHAADPQVQSSAQIAATAARWFNDPSGPPSSILFASESFGLNRLSYGGEAGAYADQVGHIVTRWDSVWDRSELWLFDFHHYLFSGETGAMIGGIVGLIGLGFVVTGVILWWRTRKTFQFRLWPRRMTRPAIVRHHRDLGVVVAPLLVLSMLTGAMMALRPVSDLLLSPFSPPADMRAAIAPPTAKGGAPAPGAIDWNRLVGDVRARYPDAEIRTIAMPKKPGGLITLRARQSAEWLPNGRTTFWFDPANGRLVDQRDALAMPTGARIFNLLYPIHAAKVGGLGYRLVITFSGLGLALLGALAMWSFWSSRRWGRERTVAQAAHPVA